MNPVVDGEAAFLYEDFVLFCRSKKVEPPSYRTFNRRLPEIVPTAKSAKRWSDEFKRKVKFWVGVVSIIE